ncbi:hypothetical protein ACU6U9_22030 [Pseudomonas sp. HK3]
MDVPSNKQQALDHVLALEGDIQKLAQAHSLATLEHKLKMRQQALEFLFEHFLADINQDDLILLKDIQVKSQNMLETMQENKHEKSEKIIKYKNTGKRIRLYSDIAQQK